MDLINSEEMRAFIAKATWKYAKTMPKYPHEYTIKDWNNGPEFEAALHYLLHYGERRKEYRWERVYLDVDGYDYWDMGDPLGVGQIINRSSHIHPIGD